MSLDDITGQVVSVLSRLPDVALELPGPFKDIPPCYFRTAPKSWDSLMISSHVSENLIRFAIRRVILVGEGMGGDGDGAQVAMNHVGELIQTCVSMEEKTRRRSVKVVWYLVRAYLWVFWQRLRVLNSSYTLDRYMRLGFQHGNESDEWLSAFTVAPGLSMQALVEQLALRKKPGNMCGWMFELLRGDPRCIGLDFGGILARFSSAFGKRSPRCRSDNDGPCDGSDWHDCLRFDQTEAADQTMHDFSDPHDPKTERRASWDEVSYRSIEGPRAVSVPLTKNGKIRYCSVSETTMAISHVWSHGQGGRPHLGINECLHRRYAQLATQFGCDSYWIDAACM